MFTLRADQVALLARNFNARQLLDGFEKLGFNGTWEEGSDEIKLVDPRGYTSRIKLDEHGRIRETLSPSGQRQQFAYDTGNRLIGYQSPTASAEWPIRAWVNLSFTKIALMLSPTLSGIPCLD